VAVNNYRRALVSPVTDLGWRLVLVLVMLLAALGDLITTEWGMYSNLTEEANPVAAHAMTMIGIPGVTLGATAICYLAATGFTLRPTSVNACAAWGMLLLITAGKVYVVVNNTHLIFFS
jgi:hypothetical protein